MTKIHYDSNNSGGEWWLTDDDWRNLEAAGWEVAWTRDQTIFGRKQGERWLGALATAANREGLTRAEAIEEFERITGQNVDDVGCECCGPPHSFYTVGDDGRYVWEN